MCLRSCVYVRRRRKGLVGPAMAPVLIKFWALFGLLESAAHVASLYLSALNGDWLVSLLRAAALLTLCSGRRLSCATRLYDARLVPFYDAQAPEVERLFAKARAVRDEVDDVCRQYATYLLERIEVGGLSGAMADLSAQAEEAKNAQGAVASGPTQRRAGRALPQDTSVFSSGRQFFAGAPDSRADAVANSSQRGIQGGVIQVAAPEPPKAAYEDLKAMRRKFSSRRGEAAKGKGKPG